VQQPAPRAVAHAAVHRPRHSGIASATIGTYRYGWTETNVGVALGLIGICAGVVQGLVGRSWRSSASARP
jgi:hypothetical protein